MIWSFSISSQKTLPTVSGTCSPSNHFILYRWSFKIQPHWVELSSNVKDFQQFLSRMFWWSSGSRRLTFAPPIFATRWWALGIYVSLNIAERASSTFYKGRRIVHTVDKYIDSIFCSLSYVHQQKPQVKLTAQHYLSVGVFFSWKGSYIVTKTIEVSASSCRHCSSEISTCNVSSG